MMSSMLSVIEKMKQYIDLIAESVKLNIEMIDNLTERVRRLEDQAKINSIQKEEDK